MVVVFQVGNVSLLRWRTTSWSTQHPHSSHFQFQAWWEWSNACRRIPLFPALKSARFRFWPFYLKLSWKENTRSQSSPKMLVVCLAAKLVTSSRFYSNHASLSVPFLDERATPCVFFVDCVAKLSHNFLMLPQLCWRSLAWLLNLKTSQWRKLSSCRRRET